MQHYDRTTITEEPIQDPTLPQNRDVVYVDQSYPMVMDFVPETM